MFDSRQVFAQTDCEQLLLPRIEDHRNALDWDLRRFHGAGAWPPEEALSHAYVIRSQTLEFTRKTVSEASVESIDIERAALEVAFEGLSNRLQDLKDKRGFVANRVTGGVLSSRRRKVWRTVLANTVESFTPDEQAAALKNARGKYQIEERGK